MANNIKLDLSEIINDFFNAEQVEELSKHLNFDRIISESGPHTNDDLDNSSFSFGPEAKANIDLMVTYASTRIDEDNYLALLLLLSSSAVTYGDFNSALDLCDKIISFTLDNPLLSNLSANAYLLKGEIYSRQANWELSFSKIDHARNLFISLSDNIGIARCENLLGTMYGDLGDLSKAVEHFETALSLTNNLDNYSFTGKIEINLGIVNTIQGNYDNAVSYFKRALLNFEKINEVKRISEINHNMGMVYTKKNDFNNALKHFDESILLAIKSGYMQTCGMAYLSKAFVYSQMKDYNLSLAFADKAMDIAYKLDDKLTIAEVYKIKGIIHRESKNFGVSENLLLTSLRINTETGNKLNEAETCHELGLLYKEMGMIEKSKVNLDKALDYFKKISAEPEIKKLESILKYLI
ncbi:MAG TPA: tetratricopeptide repeat protein [Ignavibacteriaceae bacterium]|nr:tetratricopeptide repeat protein [Ignavibacteriaceae bacterium]